MDVMGAYAFASKAPFHVTYVANLIATVMAHPMDVLRVNVQANAMRKITISELFKGMVRQRGISGFYYGFSGAFGRCSIKTVSQYSIHHELKHLLDQWKIIDEVYNGPILYGISGFGSGLISTPFAKIAIVRQTDLYRRVHDRRHFRNPLKAFLCMHQKGGLPFIFAGYKLQTFTSCAFGVFHTPICDKLEEYLSEFHSKTTTTTWEIKFFSLILTGAILSMLLTPIDAVKSIVMNSDFDELQSKRNVIQRLYRRRGIRGFFFGVIPAVAVILPYAFIATIYSKIEYKHEK